MKTTIHAYRYDMSKPTDAKAYDVLYKKMEAQGTDCFETHGGESHYQEKWNGLEVELETDFVFDNQWNTAPIPGVTDKGLRVFDWAQDYLMHGKDIKRGHYLELTPEMIEVRSNRMTCGYCGKQYDRRENPPTFCRQCLGSQYLKPEQIYLTRIAPVGLKTNRAELTEVERAELMPIYHAEQAGKGSERSRVAREKYGERIKQAYEQKRQEYENQYNGMKWLFEAGCPLRLMENCIYYSHKDVFTFGWRDKLEDGEDLDWLMKHMSEFPYEYNIVTEHRGTIGGRE